jgi:hypothetical protein
LKREVVVTTTAGEMYADWSKGVNEVRRWKIENASFFCLQIPIAMMKVCEKILANGRRIAYFLPARLFSNPLAAK